MYFKLVHTSDKSTLPRSNLMEFMTHEQVRKQNLPPTITEPGMLSYRVSTTKPTDLAMTNCSSPYAYLCYFTTMDVNATIPHAAPNNIELQGLSIHLLYAVVLLILCSHLNEHYKPVMELCHPCVVQYNMYTNFKYLPADAFWIMDLLKIPRYYYLNIESHPQTPTSALLDNFFNGNVTNRLVSTVTSYCILSHCTTV